jgi:YbbR domain-containing protein
MVQVQERLVAVEPEIVREPPRQYYYPNPPTCTPDQVLVRGPSTLVNQVTTAEARLNLQAYTESRTIARSVTLVDENDLALDNRSLAQLTIEPETVSCVIEIRPLEGVLDVQPVIVGAPAEGYRVESVTVEPEQVLVVGDSVVIESLGGNVNTDAIDISGQTGTFSRNVAVVLPEGLRLVPESQLVTVTVTISPRISTVELAEVPVQIINIDPALTATVTPAAVSVVVIGPQPLLQGLTVEDLGIMVDLSGLREGCAGGGCHGHIGTRNGGCDPCRLADCHAHPASRRPRDQSLGEGRPPQTVI